MTKQLFLFTTVNAASVNVPSLLINRSPTNHNGEKSLNSMSYHTLFFVLVLGKAYENFLLMSGVVMSWVVMYGIVMSGVVTSGVVTSGVVMSGVVMSLGCYVPGCNVWGGNVRGCNVLGL